MDVPTHDVVETGTVAQTSLAHQVAGDTEKVLPLPGWLTKVYFIFPVVLYIPDALFNYYVYSDGISSKSTNPAMQAAFVALWTFLSVGVVGMAYLLSVLAPWHWGQGHRIQAIFCGFGVLVATGITTWNSLSYRSNQFIEFQTDKWAYGLWPQLAANHVSITMILVSIAPPFWGLFWAIVQPTQTGRSLRQLQESHEERLMRMQQEAELKRLRAQTNATIREAQLRGMAQTAGAVREQAGNLLAQRRGSLSSGEAHNNSDQLIDQPDDLDENTGRASQINGQLGTPPPSPQALPVNAAPVVTLNLAAQEHMNGDDVADSTSATTATTATTESALPRKVGASARQSGTTPKRTTAAAQATVTRNFESENGGATTNSSQSLSRASRNLAFSMNAGSGRSEA